MNYPSSKRVQGIVHGDRMNLYAAWVCIHVCTVGPWVRASDRLSVSPPFDVASEIDMYHAVPLTRILSVSIDRTVVITGLQPSQGRNKTSRIK